jgi:DUF1365 family protein
MNQAIISITISFGGNMHGILFRMAYLDPSSGSLLVQLIAAGLLGSLGILTKIFWGRIKAFFKGEKYVPPQPPTDEEKIEK